MTPPAGVNRPPRGDRLVPRWHTESHNWHILIWIRLSASRHKSRPTTRFPPKIERLEKNVPNVLMCVVVCVVLFHVLFHVLCG